MYREYAGGAAGSEGKPLGKGKIDMFLGGYWLAGAEPRSPALMPNALKAARTHSSSLVREFWLWSHHIEQLFSA